MIAQSVRQRSLRAPSAVRGLLCDGMRANHDACSSMINAISAIHAARIARSLRPACDAVTRCSASNRKPPETDPLRARPSLFQRLRAKLNRGDSWLTYDLANLLPGGRIDEHVLDELETRLITADVGVETTRAHSRRAAQAGRAQGARRISMRCCRHCATSLLAILRPAARAAGDRSPVAAVRDPGRRRQRRRQDHDDRQAGAAHQGARAEGDAGRRRHVSRRRGRAVAGLGRAQRRAGDRAGGGRGSRRRRLRCDAGGEGARHRRADRRHRRPPAHAVEPDGRTEEGEARDGPRRSPARRTKCCWCSMQARARTRFSRRGCSTRRSASPASC